MEWFLVVYYEKVISMSILEGEIEITSWIEFLSISYRAYFTSDPIYLLFFFTHRKRDIGILQKANLWAYEITSKTFDESKRKRVSYTTKSVISSQMQITSPFVIPGRIFSQKVYLTHLQLARFLFFASK